MQNAPDAVAELVRDSFAKELAKLFHYYRDLMAPEFGLQGSEGSVSWEELAPSQRSLMSAAARMVLLHLTRTQLTPDSSNGVHRTDGPLEERIRLAEKGD